MTEEANPNPNPTTPPMTNSPEARTETGELKDAQSLAAGSSDENDKDAVSASQKPSASGAPESYSDFTVPEGKSLDPDLIKAATPLFKELGLSQEAAQKLIDFQLKNSGDVESKLTKSYEDLRASWRDAVKADPDIGGKLDAVSATIGRMKDQLPADVRTAFNDAMNLTGMGDHPAIVKGLYKIAELVVEGTHVNGTKPSELGQKPNGRDTRPTLAGAMYPHLSQ